MFVLIVSPVFSFFGALLFDQPGSFTATDPAGAFYSSSISCICLGELP